ncbi:hypothetical protein F4553_005371 [Allocatelliglobosispora scoriae]|uniref:Uncharacterized protein n=1 Tax=Allocatelliglobosispora scoriae TaxID=643052 RepID=A0A841BYW0_9ACTN|nr:hypothetical protein [Allocatelliglobosispora scoriae]MBB5871992.1 hypothetical protein [Allocatelliglobosispora scoriae]
MIATMRDVVRVLRFPQPGEDPRAAYAELVYLRGKRVASVMWGAAMVYAMLRDETDYDDVTLTSVMASGGVLVCGIGAFVAGQPVRAALIGAAITFALVMVGEVVSGTIADHDAVMGGTGDDEELVLVRRRRWSR